VVVCVAADLPFAMSRFCGAEGLSNVQVASTFRSDFGDSFGIRLADGKLAGLMGRAVVVLDESGTVVHSQLVPEIAQEPDYDAALGALG
jgi:thiol peroxidase